MRKKKRGTKTMSRKLIIDGNAVYEIDETCMLKQKLDEKANREEGKNGQENPGQDHAWREEQKNRK